MNSKQNRKRKKEHPAIEIAYGHLGGFTSGRAMLRRIIPNLDNRFIQEVVDTRNENALCGVVAGISAEWDLEQERMVKPGVLFFPEWEDCDARRPRL